MSTDDDIAAAMRRAATGLAACGPAPLAADVARAGKRRRARRRAFLGAAAAVAVAGTAVGAAIFTAPDQADEQVVAHGPAPRMVPIGEQTARFLLVTFPKTDDRPTPGTLATVLASTDTRRGELLLIGVELPSGKRCVLLQYAAERTPGGGGGGRCSGPGENPYAAGGAFDISGSQELDPAGGNVSAAFGSAPAGAVEVRLTAAAGVRASAPASETGGPWAGRTFFVVQWPVPKSGEITAHTADGDQIARATLPFDEK